MAAVTLSEKVLSAKSIICDIEGTTTSISFVKETLFPYALKHVQEYLKTNWNEDATKTVVVALREQSVEDKKAEVEGVVAIPAGDSEDIIPDIVANVEWQMSQDRKTGALKTLQGLVWAKGYKDGSIKGHVYDDVHKAFEGWTKSGRKIYIYSSGSVDAQKLLFEHSEHGNLLKYLTGHYDTKVGAKREKESYESILKNMETTAEDAVFLTDVFAEAQAAKEAGLSVVLLDRPGNAELSEEERKEFSVISTFSDISFNESKEENGSPMNGKRKIEEAAGTMDEDKAQEPPSKVVKVEEDSKLDSAAAAKMDDSEMVEPSSTKIEPILQPNNEVTLTDKEETMEVDSGETMTKSESDDNAEEKVKEVGHKSEEKKNETETDKKEEQAVSKELKEERTEATKNDTGKIAEEIIEKVENAPEIEKTDNERKESKGDLVNVEVVKDEEMKTDDSEKKDASKETNEVAKSPKKNDEAEPINVVVREEEQKQDTKDVKSTSTSNSGTEETKADGKKEEKQEIAATNDIQEKAKDVEVIVGVEVESKNSTDEIATEIKEDTPGAKVVATDTAESEKTKDDITSSTEGKEESSKSLNGAVIDEKQVANGNGTGPEEEKNCDSDKENDTTTEKTNGNTNESTNAEDIEIKKVVESVEPTVTASSVESES